MVALLARQESSIHLRVRAPRHAFDAIELDRAIARRARVRAVDARRWAFASAFFSAIAAARRAFGPDPGAARERRRAERHRAPRQRESHRASHRARAAHRLDVASRSPLPAASRAMSSLARSSARAAGEPSTSSRRAPSRARVAPASRERRARGVAFGRRRRRCAPPPGTTTTTPVAARRSSALPIDASFIALVNHAFTLSERDAATFVDAFCASERLTAAFCEDAFDAVYAAYARRAPEDELTTLLELAKIFTTQYKMRAMPLETRVLDETLDAGRRCAAGDVDEAEARARIRDILERAFAIEGLKQRDYIIALREYRVKLERDSRSGKSYALEFLEADETLVAELCDPDSELRASEACRRELIVATDVIFRALDGFLEVAAR